MYAYKRNGKPKICMHFKMFASTNCLLFLGLFGFQLTVSHRILRSPGKIEIDIPTQATDVEEYQENMNQEAVYWQEQYQDKEKEGHDQLDHQKEKNEEEYEKEKEHLENEQQEYQKEINETYQEDRDKVESHHNTNQEHYNQDADYNITSIQDKGNQTVENLHEETEFDDKYIDKGTEYVNNKEDDMQNYDFQDNVPTFTYTQG